MHSALVAALEHLRACYTSQGRHAEAVSLLAESSVLTPNDTMLAEKVATLQAWFDQREDHATTCRHVLRLARRRGIVRGDRFLHVRLAVAIGVLAEQQIRRCGHDVSAEVRSTL